MRREAVSTLRDELKISIPFPLLGDGEHLQRRRGRLQAQHLCIRGEAEVELLARWACLAGRAVGTAAHCSAQLLVSAMHATVSTRVYSLECKHPGGECEAACLSANRP